MARRTKALGVWLDGRRVATLEQPRWPRIVCRYTNEALGRWPQNSPVISCALPLGERPLDALSFSKGLLPEGQALQTLAARAGWAVNDTFELLARYGRDVAGALVISAEEPEPRRFGVERYTPDSLATAVNELDEHPLGSHDDSELSLAGLQDKLLLVELDGGGWGRPLHGRPSTHILKLDDPRHPGLVDAEAACLELARAAGLTTIASRLDTIGDIRCLFVSRFDRRRDGDAVLRIHQEDVCQATGTDPDANQRRAKYERAGGPSFRDVARLLDEFAAAPADELDRLASVVAFTVVTGNADAHGKNLALLHPTAETVTLAPLYDTVPTALWPRLRTEAAMTIGGQSSLPRVTLDDIVREAVSWRHSGRRAREAATKTVGVVVAAVENGAIDVEGDVGRLVRARAAELLG
jgi:serine/threonine-protein kinase HipA